MSDPSRPSTDATASPSSEAAPVASDAPHLGLVWAQADGGVIGRDGGMPWHVPEDLAHFKDVTLGAPVIMGRKTWDSLNPRYRPLPGRRNLVVTRQPDWAAEGAERAGSLGEALALAARAGETVWVIGGGQLFAEAIVAGLVDVIEVTELVHPEGFAAEPDDVLAPPVPDDFALAAADPAEGTHVSRTGIHYRFLTYRRP